MPQPRPTFNDIKTWRAARIATLAAMHEEMRRADRWLHADELDSPIRAEINHGFPPGFDFEIINYAYVIQNRATNQVFTAEVPAVTYELPAYLKEKYPKWADDEKEVQRALQGIMHRIVTETTRNPMLIGLQNQLGKGLGVISYARNYDAWGDMPSNPRGTPEDDEAWDAFNERVRRNLPWKVEALHPTWVLFDTNADPPRDYLIYRPVSRAEMARQFPKLGWDPNTRSDDTAGSACYYTEYCSEDWYGCWVDDIAVTEGGDDEGIARNRLGHPWYQMAWSGLGDMDADGRWDRWGVGVVQRGFALFKSLTFNRNWLKLIKQAYIPKLIAQGTGPGGREQAATEMQDFDPTRPTVAAFSAEVQAKWLESPQLPAALMADISKDEQNLETIFGPSVLSGQNTYAGEPASKYAERTEAARGPYRTGKAGWEQALAEMLYDFLYDFLHEPELSNGYTVHWSEGKGAGRKNYAVSLKPELIHPEGKISVDLSPLTPQDKAFKVQDAQEKQQAGWWGPERAAKEGGEIDNPQEELAQVSAWNDWQSPGMQQWRVQQLQQIMQGKLGALLAKFGVPLPPDGVTGGPAPAGAGPPGGTGAPVPLPGAPLPPNVPQQPGVLPSSHQAAAAGAQGMFEPPPTAYQNGTGGY